MGGFGKISLVGLVIISNVSLILADICTRECLDICDL